MLAEFCKSNLMLFNFLNAVLFHRDCKNRMKRYTFKLADNQLFIILTNNKSLLGL